MAGRSTSQQIFNVRLSISFTKITWSTILLVLRRRLASHEKLLIEALYANSNSAVLLNNQLGELFRTTVGVSQGCPLSPVLYNIYSLRTPCRKLQYHHIYWWKGQFVIFVLHIFAYDINLMGGSENEVQDFTTRQEEKAIACGMEVSSEKSKGLVNSTNQNTPINIMMNGQKL